MKAALRQKLGERKMKAALEILGQRLEAETRLRDTLKQEFNKVHTALEVQKARVDEIQDAIMELNRTNDIRDVVLP